MAHFAELDENNIVLRVIVVNNEDIIDDNGIEQEQKGIDFCVNLLGGVWKQTSYNGKIRKNYAGVGYKYDQDLDGFIPPQVFASWLLNEKTCQWVAPIDMPTDGKSYYWNEQVLSWTEITPFEGVTE